MKNQKVDVAKMTKELSIPSFIIKKVLGVEFDVNLAINTINNTEWCKGMYFTFPSKETRKRVLEKWNKLSLEEIKYANDLGELKEIFEDCPPKSEAREKALEKWNEISIKSIKKAKTIAEIASIQRDIPKKSLAEKELFNKLLNLIKTPEDCELAWDCTRHGSKYAKMVIKKAAEFYTK